VETTSSSSDTLGTTSSSRATLDLSKLTVAELRCEIRARGLKPKGVSKMTKKQRISFLQRWQGSIAVNFNFYLA